jgi:hypothetical protein
LISSIKYNNFNDGKAINNKINAGIIVQIISIICPDKKYRLINLLKNKINIKYVTKIVIIVKTIIE